METLSKNIQERGKRKDEEKGKTGWNGSNTALWCLDGGCCGGEENCVIEIG